MDIKKFYFKDLKNISALLEQELTLGEFLEASTAIEPMKEESVNLGNEASNDLSDFITKTESNKLVNESYEHGYSEGMKSIQKQIDSKEQELLAQNNLILEKIEKTLKEIRFYDSAEVLSINLEHIQHLSINIAKKIASKALTDNFIYLIEETIEKYIKSLKSNKKIIIKINPQFKSIQESLISKYDKLIEGELKILLDNDLDPYDVKIEFEHGIIERNINQIIEDIEKITSK